MRKPSRREFVSGLLGAAVLPAAVPEAEVLDAPTAELLPERPPCGLRELPVGWIFEYGLKGWNGDTSKSFVQERSRPYEEGGRRFTAEEYARHSCEGLRECHRRHGIVVLRYYPVYAGRAVDGLAEKPKKRRRMGRIGA